MFWEYKKNNSKRKAGNLARASAKWKLLLTYSDQEKGNIMVVALGIGFLLIVIGMQSVLSSSQSKLNSLAHESKTRSMEIAEGGVSRYIALVNQNRAIATYCANTIDPLDPEYSTYPACASGTTWSNISSSVIEAYNTASGSCSSGPVTTTIVNQIQGASTTTNWQSLGSDGEYKLISYYYSPASGTGNTSPGTADLTIEGRRTGVDDAISRIRVTIPITVPPVPFEVPGVWAKDTTGNPDPIQISNAESIQANIRQECSNPDAGQGADNTALAGYPSIMTIYDGSTPSVGQIDRKMPSTPGVPGGVTPYSIPSLDLSACWVELPRTGGTHTNCSGLSGTFNGVTDTPDSDGRYHYVFEQVSGLSVKLSNSAILINTPLSSEKVIFYFKGSIDISGTGANGSGTSLSCTHGSTTPVTTFINQGVPNKLEIYGADGSVSWAGGQTALDVKASDTTMINAFIHFPEATADLSQSQINGAIWVKKFKSSHAGYGGTSGCAVGMIQEDVGSNLIVFSANGSNRLNPVTNWQRMSR